MLRCSTSEDAACIFWHPLYTGSYIVPNVHYAVSYNGDTSQAIYALATPSEKAIADFTEAIRIDPQFVEAYYNRAIVFSNLCNYEKAILDYHTVIKLKPDYVAAHNNLGNLYMQTLYGFAISRADTLAIPGTTGQEAQNGYGYRVKVAIQNYSTAIELSPKSGELLFNRGLAYQWIGENEKAIDDFSQAIRLNAEFIDAYYQRGLLYNLLKDYAKTVTDMTRVIELTQSDLPQRDKPYGFRADALSAQGKFEDAIMDYTRAIELDPVDKLNYLQRAEAYAHTGEPEKALTDLSKAISLDSKDATAYYNRGTVWVDLGKHKEAIDDFTQAIIISPTLDFAYNNRGISYEVLGQREKAISDLSQAIALNPNNPVAYMNRGDAYRMAGELAKALADYCIVTKHANGSKMLSIIEGRFRDIGKSVSDCQPAKQDPN